MPYDEECPEWAESLAKMHAGDFEAGELDALKDHLKMCRACREIRQAYENHAALIKARGNGEGCTNLPQPPSIEESWKKLKDAMNKESDDET